MKLNDNTILRIKVPANLYESVKAQLTLKEGKNDYGMPEGTVIKEKTTSDGKPKAASERRGSKKTSTHKKKEDPNAPQQKTGAMYDDETSRLGAGVSEAKKMGLEEFKALAELLHAEIAKLEEKAEHKGEETPMEEKKEVKKGHEKEGQE